MPEKEEKPMCPILTAAAYNKSIGDSITLTGYIKIPCEGADCAWWPKWGKGCAILAIADAIGDVEINLTQQISMEP